MGLPSVHHRAMLAFAAGVAFLAFTSRLASEEPFRTWRDRGGTYDARELPADDVWHDYFTRS